MMNRIILLILAFMLSGLAAHAEDAVEKSPAEQMPSSTATRTWLDMQSSGQEASRQPQPLSGEAMEKIHKRYIDSFGKPIPEYYKHESFTDN